MRRLGPATAAAALVGGALWLAVAPAAAKPQDTLRAAWVGRWVVLRSAAMSNCDARYTDNRMQGLHPSSSGDHHFAPGELARVDNLHLQRARIDLLVALAEPLRVELRDGPFQLYEHRECRVELEIPAPREAVRQGSIAQLEDLIRGVVEGPLERAGAEASGAWNRRRVEPLPDDHEERLAAYHAWKEEQLYLALRGRLAEALDRAFDIGSRADRGGSYADGLTEGLRDFERDGLYSADCPELVDARFSSDRGRPPEALEDREARAWKDGFEDGQRLLFEISLARRIERCLP